MKVWLRSSFQQAAWAPLVVLAFCVVAAEGFNAYILYPWLDIPTHFFGGLAVTYFFSVAIGHSQVQIGPIPKLVQLLLSVGLMAIAAAVWEFVEFLSDVILGTKMVHGVSDTVSDLFFDLLGSAVMVAILARSGRIRVTPAKGVTNEP